MRDDAMWRKYLLPEIHGPSPLGAGELQPHDAGLFGVVQTDFKGTRHDDTQDGSQLDDTFNYAQGGNDTLRGLEGNDTFKFGAKFDTLDSIDGGTGVDRLILQGDYTAGQNWTSANIVNVDRLFLNPGAGYNFTVDNSVLVAGQTLIVDGHTLHAGQNISFNGGAETDGGRFEMYGGAGDDTFVLTDSGELAKGGAGNDSIAMGAGADGAWGGDGDDLVDLSFSSTDEINGGAGFDILTANVAGIADPITATDHTFVGLEEVDFYSTNSFAFSGIDLTLADGNVARGKTLTIGITGGALALVAGAIDGSAETNGHFNMFGWFFSDTLIGGHLSDTFDIADGGADTVGCNAGDDTINAGAGLDQTDRIDGGVGVDTLNLDGDYSDGLTFDDMTVVNVESIILAAGNSYKLTIADGTVAEGETLTVDGSALANTQTFNFVGDSEPNGHLNIIGGRGADLLSGGSQADTLSGGNGNDTLRGGGGSDSITGGGGHDQFVAYGGTDSISVTHDTIVSFDANMDQFVLSSSVQGIASEITHGRLSEGTFDADLTNAVGAAELPLFNAVSYTPDHGGLRGHTFLIVDNGNQAGYQNGDYVFELQSPTNLNHLDVSDFSAIV